MKVLLTSFVVLWALISLSQQKQAAAYDYEIYQTQDPLFVAARSSDIEKHCSSFLNSALELKPDDNRGGRLKTELTFYLGDWDQKETDGAPPLLQLDDGDDNGSQSLKLVSFEVKDVSSLQQLENTVSLRGVLYLGISRNSSSGFTNGYDPRTNPGSSVLVVKFEGVYMETKENGGERLMCLLGSSTSTSNLLSTDKNECDCDEFPEFGSGYFPRHQTRFLQDDQVLLVLRYPNTFNLTRRAIQGDMVSLNKHGDSRYFSKVYISSQLNCKSKYQFSPEVLLQSRTNDHPPPPYQDELKEDGVQVFTGQEICRVLEHLAGETLNVIPNYRFSNGYMNRIHGKLGPFLLEKEMEATGGLNYDDIKLLFKLVKCKVDTSSISSGNAKVLTVLRAVPKGSFRQFEGFRTGLSGLTLTAEGIWNSSSGQLLMVGCQGMVESGLEGCDYEIAMYFPRILSIKQRSHLFGSIWNLKNDVGPDNPLFLKSKTSSSQDHFSYSYSKIESINMFERRTLSHRISATVKWLLFRYPALRDAEEPLEEFRQLFTTLSLNGDVVPIVSMDGQKQGMFNFQIEVLSLGPLSGWNGPYLGNRGGRKKPVITKDDLTSCQGFLNVSMHLVFKNQKYEQTTYKNVSELSLEGLYDPLSGEMHLIGCRRALVESISMERGQDCLIEVKIQYRPINFLWWKNPTAKITISSQRQEDDPLYFSLISLHAHLNYNPDYSQTTTMYGAFFEAVLSILLLAGSSVIIWSQLKVEADVVPYISTSMLAFQILGYSLPLICSAKALFKSKISEAYRALPCDHPAFGMLQFLLSFEKILLLVDLLLTARLFQIVIESRSKTRYSKETSNNSRFRYASKEKQVILSTMAIFTLGFLIWVDNNLDAPLQPVMIHVQQQQQQQRQQPGYKEILALKNRHIWQTWMVLTEGLAFVLQDFFLLPQMLSNMLMPMPVKSLKEAYYLGFTSIRLVVHFFEYYMMDPVSPSKMERFKPMTMPNSNSTSELLAKVASPITMIMTAVIVYIQQSWKHQNLVYSPKQGHM